MLNIQIECYISLRQTLGYKLRELSANLRAFAKFATAKRESHVHASTALDWAREASSPRARYIRLRDIAHLARFLHTEDPAHEVPSNPFRAPKCRRLPYIYAPEEIAQLIAAAGRLRASYPLRRRVYGTLLGLVAATGLRISEALNLRLGDVLPQGVLQIRHAKFSKSRLVPCTQRSRRHLTTTLSSAIGWLWRTTTCFCRQAISALPPVRWSTPSAASADSPPLPRRGHAHRGSMI